MPLALHITIFKKKYTRIFLEEIVKLPIVFSKVTTYNRKFNNFHKEYPCRFFVENHHMQCKGDNSKNVPISEVCHHAHTPPTTLYQGSHCRTSTIGCVKFCSRVYVQHLKASHAFLQPSSTTTSRSQVKMYVRKFLKYKLRPLIFDEDNLNICLSQNISVPEANASKLRDISHNFCV